MAEESEEAEGWRSGQAVGWAGRGVGRSGELSRVPT